jgi:hypothetical protein
MNGRREDGRDARDGRDGLPFRAAELEGGDRPFSAAEHARAEGAARQLEQSLAGRDVRPSSGFSTRVMAAIAAEPLPSQRGYLLPLHRRGPAGMIESFRQALAFGRSGSRPLGARVGALAYVLAVLVLAISLTGVAAYGAVGAMGLLAPPPSPQPSPTLPAPTESRPPSPSPSTSPPEPSIEPVETEGSDAGAAPTEDPPTASPRPAPGVEGLATPRAWASAAEDDHETGWPAASGAAWPSASPGGSGLDH